MAWEPRLERSLPRCRHGGSTLRSKELRATGRFHARSPHRWGREGLFPCKMPVGHGFPRWKTVPLIQEGRGSGGSEPRDTVAMTFRRFSGERATCTARTNLAQQSLGSLGIRRPARCPERYRPTRRASTTETLETRIAAMNPARTAAIIPTTNAPKITKGITSIFAV